MFILVYKGEIVGISDGNTKPGDGYVQYSFPPNCTSLEQVYFDTKTNTVQPRPPKPNDGQEYAWVSNKWQPLINNNFMLIPDDGLTEQQLFKEAIASTNVEVIKWLSVCLYADATNRYPLLSRSTSKLKEALKISTVVPTPPTATTVTTPTKTTTK